MRNDPTVGLILGIYGDQGPRSWAHRPPWSWRTLTAKVAHEDYFGACKGQTRAEFLASARLLARQGADVITADCSYAAVFQEDVASAVNRPVLLSVLSTLPGLLGPLNRNAEVAVLTADPARFTALVESDEALAQLLGRLRLLDLDGLPPEGATEAEEARAVERVLAPRVAALKPKALVLSCTDLVPHASRFRDVLSMPVFDVASTLATMIR